MILKISKTILATLVTLVTAFAGIHVRASGKTYSSENLQKYRYVYYGYESTRARKAMLAFDIHKDGTVKGIMIVHGLCDPGHAVLMGGEVHFSGYLTGSYPQVKGISHEKSYSSCPGATGFVTQGSGTIRIGYYSHFKLFVQLFGNNGSGTEWYFKHPASGVPENPFARTVSMGKNQEAETIEQIGHASPPTQINSVAGAWQTNFGRMVLHQRGFRVWGNYTHDKGKIEGTLRGRVLVGRWSEAPSYRPPKDAGDFRFRFSEDGQSFQGRWRYGFGGAKWNGHWSGYPLMGEGGR